MAQWGFGEELSEKSFQANRAMELLKRNTGPSLGHMVSYYGSDMKFGPPCWVCQKRDAHGGDTAFELTHGINLYYYMYKVEELEYSSDKTKLPAAASEMSTKESRREFADNYDRAMNMFWSYTMRGQMCLLCTPGISAGESWISGVDRVSSSLAFLNYPDVNRRTGYFWTFRMLLSVQMDSLPMKTYRTAE